ncbi:uncharacterized protein F54H12.2-like [Oppia nitens]|uniref:uncharacterized protein F54H12.2-like n=1 Tax=Oppia nitens TaxID=1686743 RepID=UPI0023DB9D18|nr:uncharacterized protein F54H12.2-like [Oppia nitens]
MAAIHKLSSVTALSEFDIFGVPPTQNTIEKDILTEHRPASAIDSKAYIEFNLSTGIDEYLRLDKTIVTLSHQTYPYKSDLEIKLGKNKEAKDSYLSSILWIEDNLNDLEGINLNRTNYIKPLVGDTDLSKGRELDLIGKLHIPMFEQRKALLGGCNISLKLIPNSPSFYMMCDSSIRISSVEFKDASLYIHRSKINPAVVEGHKMALLKPANVRYPIRESFVVPITINKGTMDTIIDNVHNGQLPRRAFVTMVDHSAFNGSEIKNPYNYKNYNLNYLAFYLNGIQYPEKAFTPDFDKNLYVREYISLFEATNQDNVDSCITLKRQDFPKGNNIFAVNFNPDLSSGCCATGYVNPIKHGNLRLQLRFKEPLANAITVLVYLDYDALLEIDYDRNPIYTFN